jgi:hypothetical protein
MEILLELISIKYLLASELQDQVLEMNGNWIISKDSLLWVMAIYAPAEKFCEID